MRTLPEMPQTGLRTGLDAAKLSGAVGRSRTEAAGERAARKAARAGFDFMTVPELIEITLTTANAAPFTPRVHDVVIEHRLTSGVFRFQVLSVELRDGVVVLVTDGKAI